MKSTPHIKPDGIEIAETVLLPGDPLRAKFIADNYLENAVQFNTIRNMFGFTGTYNGKKISVMGSGMGMASIGIYSWELINVFGVKNLIRIGSCGAIQENLKLYDVILANGVSTDSNYASQYNCPGTLSAVASFDLLVKAKNVADDKKIPVHIGQCLSSDIFYNDDETVLMKWKKMGILGVEMEAAALYYNAARFGVNALAILTVSDQILTNEKASAEERQTAFTKMMEIALELA